MGEFADLNQAARDIWDRNAAFWDERMGEGNKWHRLLIAPAQERLLALRRDELVLDIACGNGQFARHMARLGARVVASDVAPQMIEHARARTTKQADRIEYRVLDATSREQLLALGERRFDAAVCTMALMDMAAIEPLLAGLSRLLKVGGRFVFSVPHPCFNSVAPRMKKVVEIEERDGEISHGVCDQGLGLHPTDRGERRGYTRPAGGPILLRAAHQSLVRHVLSGWLCPRWPRRAGLRVAAATGAAR